MAERERDRESKKRERERERPNVTAPRLPSRCDDVVLLALVTHLSFQTGSRCFLMSSRMESSHIQKLKGFPGMFSCNKGVANFKSILE